jgi:hypothetical protein
MPLSLLNHSALALFAHRTLILTSARSTGFCAIWICISYYFEFEFEFEAGGGYHFNGKKFCPWLGMA